MPQEIEPPAEFINLAMHVFYKSQWMKTEEAEEIKASNPPVWQAMNQHIQMLKMMAAPPPGRRRTRGRRRQGHTGRLGARARDSVGHSEAGRRQAEESARSHGRLRTLAAGRAEAGVRARDVSVLLRDAVRALLREVEDSIVVDDRSALGRLRHLIRLEERAEHPMEPAIARETDRRVARIGAGPRVVQEAGRTLHRVPRRHGRATRARMPVAGRKPR
jgi:hypothetical protein